jgi:hypothetical protein
MTDAGRVRALRELDDSRTRLTSVVAGLSPPQLAHKPDADRWSVAECLEHIIVVKRFLFDRLTELASQASSATVESEWAGRDDAFVEQVTGRTRHIVSAEAVRPTGRSPPEQLLPTFDAVRAKLRHFVASSTADLRARPVLHPALGKSTAISCSCSFPRTATATARRAKM